MEKMKIIILPCCLSFLLSITYGQDTVYLVKPPKIIIKSWYPGFEEFPKLKIGKSLILFTVIPDLEKTSIRNNDIDLKTSGSQVTVEETEKTNQYLVTVNPTHAKYVEFEVWFDLEDNKVMLKRGSKWEDVKNLYPMKGNRILIDKVKLHLME
jgi:hypothetical protein